MLCLENFAAGHLDVSASHHVHVQFALFDLDLTLGYLGNLKAVALDDILFFSTQPQV